MTASPVKSSRRLPPQEKIALERMAPVTLQEVETIRIR